MAKSCNIPLASLGRMTALAAAVVVPAQMLGQILEAGPLLSFDLGLRVESDSNNDLTAPRKEPRHGAQLRFGVNYLSETEISKLEFSANGALAGYGGLGARPSQEGFVSPRLRLSYDRAVADADLNLTLSLDETGLNTFDPTAEDFAGSGTRRLGKISGAINWGKTDPLGFGLRASSERASYYDAPGRVDYRTDRIGAKIRADLTEVLQADADLSTQLYRPEGRPDRRTHAARLGLNLLRPTGSLRFGIGLDDTPEGDRQRATLGQVLELPSGGLSWTLGLVRDTRGRSRPMGDFSWHRDLPDGRMGLTLSRDVTSSETTDRETLQNRLSVFYQKQVTQTGGLQLGASWSESSYRGTGEKITAGQFSAVWNQAITEDWGLNLGYVHSNREAGIAPRRSSDRVYLELNRRFEVKF